MNMTTDTLHFVPVNVSQQEKGPSGDPTCPYNDKACPKIAEMKATIEQNSKDLKRLNTSIAELKSSQSTSMWIIGLLVTLIGGGAVIL